MGALVTRRVSRSLPVGRAIAAPEWRSLGLQSLTLFQSTDLETVNGALVPSNLTRSGTGHVLKAGAALGVGVSQNGGNNTWSTNGGGRIIGFGTNQFAVAIAFQLNSLGQTSKYLAIDGSGTFQSALIYGYGTGGTANSVEFFAQGYTGTDPRTGSAILVNDLLPHVIVYTYDGVTWRGFLDGVEKFAIARTFALTATNGSVGFIGGASASASVANVTFFAHARFSAGLPRAAAARFSGLFAQTAFKQPARRLWAPYAVSLNGYILQAAAANFVVAAQQTGLKAARRLVASAAPVTLTAASARLIGSRRVSASVGSFALSGSSVQLTYTPVQAPVGPTYTLTSAVGAFGLTAPAVGMKAARKLPAAVGALAVSGKVVTLRASRKLGAQPGAFNLAGTVVQLRYSASSPTPGPVTVSESVVPASRRVTFAGGIRTVKFDGGIRQVVFSSAATTTVRF